MALGETRRKFRILSYRTAAQMIVTHLEGGITADDLNMTEEEFFLFEEENTRTAEKLNAMADKLEGI